MQTLNPSSPYTPAGGSNMPTAPRLGTPVPGTTGGLPQKPGLSVFDNPMAGQLQSDPQQGAQQAQQFGRGQDSVLVHMTPNEVNSLRGLAQQFGGDLSTNPHTGLPEAGFLGKILPTILGGIGMAFGIPPIWMGALGAAGGTAATGSLSKGLMMGLGAFGGASLGGAAGIGGKLGHIGQGLGLSGSGAAVMHPTASFASQAADKAANAAMNTVASKGLDVSSNAAQNIFGNAGKQFAQPSGVLGGFGQSASAGLGTGLAAKAAPVAAGLGLLNAATPSVPTYKDKKKPSEFGYTGNYSVAEDRVLQTGPVGTNEAGVAVTPEGKRTSVEQLYYKPTTSYADSTGKAWTPGEKTTPLTNVGTSSKPKWVYTSELDQYNQQQQAKKEAGKGGLAGIFRQPPPEWVEQRYAKGGELFHMESGGHVFPAKAVSAYGNFDTNAGQERLSKLGGIPIRGAGDGVSDSIPARIDGEQEARVANGEVYFPPKVVQRLGGNQKLYAMMRNAEKAANRAKSGEKVKGLGAL